MMSGALSSNRGMFWRIVRRLLFAHRGRLFVILLALVAGAAITAALLNLQVDAKRRLTTEFRTFGPNVMLAAAGGNSDASAATLDEKLLTQLPLMSAGGHVSGTAYLYVIAEARTKLGQNVPVVVAGIHSLDSSNLEASASPVLRQACFIGGKFAGQTDLRVGDELALHGTGQNELCRVARITSRGGPEDSQVSPHLDVAQRLAGLRDRVSVIQLTVPGTSQQVSAYVTELKERFPGIAVRPATQFTEAQAKIYSRISGLLNFTVALVLVLTALCVMAAMANVAMERRNDVGLMKAIGGARRRVLRLFLTEAVLLGLTGGLIGAAAGIALSIYLGKAVFGLAARPRLIVYPVAVTLTVLVAIFSAYPLRYLANVRPASVFRGEA